MNETKESLLLIDDDVELCELVEEYLQTEGFEIDVVHDGTEGLERVLSSEPILVILDVMLPGANGFEVLRRIRSRSQVPVLMLTARGDDVDRIVGLEIGADDYLPKPFNPRELVARIRAILRRSQPGAGVSKQPIHGTGRPDSQIPGGPVNWRCGVSLALPVFDDATDPSSAGIA